MRTLGFMIFALGVLSLLYGGITYGRQKMVLDTGPIRATAAEQPKVPLSPIVGGISVVAGLLLLAMPRRRAVTAGGGR